MRTHGNGAREGATGFRFAFEQNLLLDFTTTPARSTTLGWEFRGLCAASYGFRLDCCETPSGKRMVSG